MASKFLWKRVLKDSNHWRCLSDLGVFMEVFASESAQEAPFVCLVHGKRHADDGGDTFEYLGWGKTLDEAMNHAEDMAAELEEIETERAHGHAS